MNQVWTPESQAKAIQEAESWRGTPHRHRIAARGRGIDCIRFVAAVMVAAEVVEPTEIPSYPTAVGLANVDNKMVRALLGCLDAVEIPADEWDPQFGDLCVWKCGQNANHLAIRLASQVWHVSTLSPVGPMTSEAARRRMQCAIRLRARGWTKSPANIRFSQL